MNERFRFFVSLVDRGSFTEAAKALHISQPALSIAIQKLERELQASLLVRRHRAFELTEAGKLVYAAAREMNTQRRNLQLELGELSHQKPAVSIGMIDSIADALFASKDSFDKLDKRAKISLSVNDSTYLLEMLAGDEIDIAFVSGQPSLLGTTLEETPLSREPLVIVTHKDSLKKVQLDVRRGQLMQFLSYNQNSITSRLIQHALTQRGIGIIPTFYSTSPEILLRVVLSGRGTTVLPYLTVKNYLISGQLSAVRIGGSCVIWRPIRLVKQKNRKLISPLRLVTHRIAAIHESLSSEAAWLDTGNKDSLFSQGLE